MSLPRPRLFLAFGSLFALLALTLVGGCGGGDDGAIGDADGTQERVEVERTVGYSAMALKNPFFQEIADTMKAEGARHNLTIQVDDADNKPEEQAKQLESYIASGVDAIVLNPVDRTALGPAIKKANEAGIPVFTCDLQCEAEGAKIAAHVGTDNLQGGRLAGQAMIDALGESGGKVAILHFKQANSCVLRVQGFRDVIEQHNQQNPDGKIEIVAELEGGGDRSVSYKAMADALQAHPNLSGVFAINDPSALGAWRAIKDVEKTDQITIVGFDGFTEGKLAIRDGKIYADPIQFPKQMAKQTVENIVSYINGGEVEPVILIPTELYTQEDALQDPELADAEAE